MSTPSFLPFLYRTRTLQVISGASRRHVVQGLRPRRAYANREGQDFIPFDLPADLDGLKPVAGRVDNGQQGRSTITPSERHAFDLIFKELASRYATAPTHGSSSVANGLDVGSIPKVAARSAAPLKSNVVPGDAEDSRKIQQVIDVILQDASSAESADTNALRKPARRQRHSQTSHEGAIQAFPESLRQTARATLQGLQIHETGTHEQETGPAEVAHVQGSADALAQESQSAAVQWERVRRDERMRVETLMHGAPTDVALWEVLEKEVFSMVERLGIAGIAQGQPQRGLPRTAKLPSRPRQQPGSATAAKVRPYAPLSMPIYGPLYPSHLLLALRLLDSAYAWPSPLALAILPRVKQLGLASYVLGGTTPMYNELARILWRRRADAGAVLRLLEEMRHAGLGYDEASLGVVEEMQAQLEPGDRGFLGGVAAVTHLGHDMGRRIRYWQAHLRFLLGHPEAAGATS